MDVPISLGVILVTGMSLAQTMQGGAHTYFDSAVTLLFFLLIGRVLDHRARGQARATAEQLLTLRAADVAVLQADGSIAAPRPAAGRPRASACWSALGERIGVDGVVGARHRRCWMPAWSPARACRSPPHRARRCSPAR